MTQSNRPHMREIKFRAWDKARKYQVTSPNRAEFFVNKYGELSAKNYLPGNRAEQQLEIVQYTGLKDKNGKEIYEGDIFKAPHDFGPGGYHEKIGSVRFDEILGYQWQYWHLPDLEVIGNIYENPELLEGKQFMGQRRRLPHPTGVMRR